MIWNRKLINVRFSLSTQRLMIKTTRKSDLPWSSIFSVIVYLRPPKVSWFCFSCLAFLQDACLLNVGLELSRSPWPTSFSKYWNSIVRRFLLSEWLNQRLSSLSKYTDGDKDLGESPFHFQFLGFFSFEILGWPIKLFRALFWVHDDKRQADDPSTTVYSFYRHP